MLLSPTRKKFSGPAVATAPPVCWRILFSVSRLRGCRAVESIFVGGVNVNSPNMTMYSKSSSVVEICFHFEDVRGLRRVNSCMDDERIGGFRCEAAIRVSHVQRLATTVTKLNENV